MTQCRTKEVASAAAEGASLMAIQTNDSRITLVAGGYPLFANGKIAGGICVGGGIEEQDCAIAECSGGIYHKSQIELTYNSNHIEGSRLTH